FRAAKLFILPPTFPQCETLFIPLRPAMVQAQGARRGRSAQRFLASIAGGSKGLLCFAESVLAASAAVSIPFGITHARMQADTTSFEKVGIVADQGTYWQREQLQPELISPANGRKRKWFKQVHGAS